MQLYQVKLDLTQPQLRQLAKKKPTQIKKDQLDGKILVSLNKDNWKRYKRAIKNKSGFRIVMDDDMIHGSGFSDLLKGLKSGAQKIGSVAIPYLKDKLKSLLPSLRSDINSAVNSGTDNIASKLKSGLSPFLGNALTDELVNKGSASVKNFATDKLNQAQGYLQGLGYKKNSDFRVTKGGKFSLNFLKPFVRPLASIGVPALATAFGGPSAGLAASAVTDALLSSQGMGVPPILYLKRPGALPHEKEQLKGKGLLVAAPKRKAKGRPKKINGAALFPMGRGGALFPM